MRQIRKEMEIKGFNFRWWWRTRSNKKVVCFEGRKTVSFNRSKFPYYRGKYSSFGDGSNIRACRSVATSSAVSRALEHVHFNVSFI